jgi:hypothetical protein
MKNLNIIKSVTELLTASDLNDVKKYNEIKDSLNVNFLEQDILSTIKYIRGEYTTSEEKIFLDICIPVINEI